MIGHVELHAALLVGQRHHGAYIVLRHIQLHGDDGLPDFTDATRVWNLRWVLNHDYLAIGPEYLVHHTRCCGDQVLVELAL